MAAKTLGERIEMWPWSKTIILVGIVSFLLSQSVAAFLSLLVIKFPIFQPRPDQSWMVDRMVRVFEIAQEGSLWAMGVGGASLAGKRATTKADVIDAQVKAVQAGVGSTTVDGVQEIHHTTDRDKGDPS